MEHVGGLQATFAVDITADDPAIHPQFFCNACHSAVQRHGVAASKGLPSNHSIAVFSWVKHSHSAVQRHGVAASKGLPSNHSIAVFSWVKHKDHDCDVSYTVKIDKSWVKHKYHDCDVSYTVRIDKVKLQ